MPEKTSLYCSVPYSTLITQRSSESAGNSGAQSREDVDRGEHEPRLLTVKQAARFLATTPKTLYAMVWRREIVFVKIGRSVRFDLKDLEQMIERAKVIPREQAVHRERFPGGGRGGRL